MADGALCRSAGPVVSRGVLRQRSDDLNYHHGSYNYTHHHVEHNDYSYNYTYDNLHNRNNDVYFHHTYYRNNYHIRTDHAHR